MPRALRAEAYEESLVSVWDGERYQWRSVAEARRTRHFCTEHDEPHRHIDRPTGVIIGCTTCVGNGVLEKATKA